MLVSYETYMKAAGPDPLAQAEYERVAPIADLVLDNWTLGRTSRASSDGEELPASVTALYVAVAGALPSVMEESRGGERVKSFSNGVDSFTFADAALSARLEEQLGWMLRLLPVEWVSECVAFEGGACYAG